MTSWPALLAIATLGMTLAFGLPWAAETLTRKPQQPARRPPPPARKG